MLNGIKVGRNGIMVGFLQFAPNTIFICEVESSNIITIRSILKCFELASDLMLKFNFYKSMGGVGYG